MDKPSRAETIKKELANGPKTNRELRKKLGMKASDTKLDRELQKLRKGGEVRTERGLWQLTSAQVCPHCKGRGWTSST